MADLAELFARDPLSYKRVDLDEIVRALRDQRKNFNLGDKTAGNAKKATTAAPSLNLEALGLKLPTKEG